MNRGNNTSKKFEAGNSKVRGKVESKWGLDTKRPGGQA